MDRLIERLAMAKKAHATLVAVLREPVGEVVRDASIQRFEYTFEAVWKAVQLYLRREEGQEVASPKGAVRLSFQTGLLSEAEAELAMGMVEDRNLTVHTYNEELADLIYGRLGGYCALLGVWVERMAATGGQKAG